MTEREYVDTLKKAAEDYIAVVGREPSQPHQVGDGARVKAWEMLTAQMSPHTFVRLANAWAAQQERTQPAALGTGPSQCCDGRDDQCALEGCLVKLNAKYAGKRLPIGLHGANIRHAVLMAGPTPPIAAAGSTAPLSERAVGGAVASESLAPSNSEVGKP